ncbi:MAG: type II toxin-antitoxin system RelE/ParE family toxin [Rhodospirillaceae bacterium]
MKIVIETSALKVLFRMPKSDAVGLRAKLKAFAADPYGRPPWAKAFESKMGHIRHGDWRAVYEIDGDQLLITALKIGNRKEIYR